MSATIAYLRNRNYTGLDDIVQIKNDFYKVNITVSYDSDIINGKRRVIFTATKGTRSQNFDKIKYECNGLILEAPTWNPITVPCPTPKISINNEIISKLLNQNKYNIYKITDGTVIYLYNWQNTWSISTARGINMNSVKYNGITYLELLEYVLGKYNTTFDEFTNTLDKNASYSFVIRNNKIHPFTQESEEGLVFVHKTIINNGNIEYIRSVHNLPYNIPYQEEVQGEVKLREIYSSLSTSLSNWCLTKKNPLFGYILISKVPYKVGGDHSCILLESSLMRQIRQFVYDRRYMEFGEDKELATVIHGYLSSQRTTFIDLFPQYLPLHEKLEVLQKELVNKVLEYTAKNLVDAKDNDAKVDSDEKENNMTEFNNISADNIQYLSEYIHRKLTLDTDNYEESKKHILGIINNTKFTKMYICLLNDN